MSRNFELLKQLEVEVGSPDHPTPAQEQRVFVKEVPFPEQSELFGAEMARLIQTIYQPKSGRAPRRVMFCGVEDGNGSSTVCASAARALAANINESVCIADANIHARRLTSTFGVDTSNPFFEPPRTTREQCLKLDRNLWFAGIDQFVNERGLLLSPDELRDHLIQLQAAFDYVLVDAPGATASRDAALLGQLVDGVILILEANRTRKATALRAKEMLEASGVKLMGTILNNRTFAIPEAIYRRV
jgi:protein-tyrosine kinase